MSANYQDPLSWSLELETHFSGEFSMACVQSRIRVEDKLVIDSCDKATFIGLYDGYEGDEASNYLQEQFLPTLLRNITDYANRFETTQVPSTEVIHLLRQTFDNLENGFTVIAERGHREKKPSMSVVSSGCLVSLIWGKKLFTANVGDSLGVIFYDKPDGGLGGRELAKDTSRCDQVYIRQPSHPNTKCIGNAYLKRAAFTREQSFEAPAEYMLESVLTEPVLSATPEIFTRTLKETDRFIIFGSGGFWKLLTVMEAATIINSHPRDGIARRLATHAVKVAAEKAGLTYSNMMLIPEGNEISGRPLSSSEPVRPLYHDDITVTVVYLDITKKVESKEFHSYQSHSYNILPSGFKDNQSNIQQQ